MDAVKNETLKQYYDLLEGMLRENNLMDSPSCVYNVDKMGIPLDPKAPKVVAPVGMKKVRYQSPGRKGQIHNRCWLWQYRRVSDTSVNYF